MPTLSDLGPVLSGIASLLPDIRLLRPDVGPILLTLCSFLGTLLLAIGLSTFRPEPSRARSRLVRFAARQMTLREIELEQPFTERVVRPMILSVSRPLLRFIPRTGKGPAKTLSGLQRKLLLAGNPYGLSAHDFVGVVALSTLIWGAVIFILAILASSDPAASVLLSVVGLALGYLLPTLWLSAGIARRRTEITRAMPDCLDLLAISVEAGLGFDAAIRRYTEKTTNALSKEFTRVSAEVHMGRARREALKEMATRTEVPDLNTFVSAIIQADQLGVSISRVLTVQAEQMRVLRRQRAEELAAQATVKMIFPTVLLIFPAMFVVLLGPSVVTIFGGQNPF